MNEQIVRRYAGLSGVQEFTHGDFFRSNAEIRILFNNGRIFTAEFKSNRYKLFSCLLVNDFSDSSASSIENMIEAEITDHRPDQFSAITKNDGYILWQKDFVDYFFNKAARWLVPVPKV